MGRAPCCDKNGLKKGPWTPEEDQKLINYIRENGCGNWRTLPKIAGLQRCGKSCRLRWTNYLRPDIKRGKFSVEEEETIIHLHRVLGNKWSTIATRLPGRTDNEIKNYWNTNIRKKLLRMGIDPVTHSPRLDFLDVNTVLNSSLCCNDQSYISRLLGLQNLINPNLIRLLLPNQRCYDQGFLVQDQSSHQLLNNDVIDQIPTVTCHDDSQLLQHSVQWAQHCNYDNNNGAMFPVNVCEDNYVPMNTNYGCYGSDQSFFDHNLSSESSNFQSNFSFQSVLSSLSSPSSIPTPLSSNSIHAEDERGSY